jgi:hypothetical protein
MALSLFLFAGMNLDRLLLVIMTIVICTFAVRDMQAHPDYWAGKLRVLKPRILSVVSARPRIPKVDTSSNKPDVPSNGRPKIISVDEEKK